MKDKLLFGLGVVLGAGLVEALLLAGVAKGMRVERERILVWLEKECNHPVAVSAHRLIQNKEHWKPLR